MKNIKLLSLFVFSLFQIVTIAQTITVQNLNDSGIGSFREAISIANPNDTIRFNPSLIALGSDTLVLDTVININKNLVIKGLYDNQDTLFISSEDSQSFFLVDSVDIIVFDSLIFQFQNNGVLQGGIGSFESNLEINNCVFRGFKEYLFTFHQSSFKIFNTTLTTDYISAGGSPTNIICVALDSQNYSFEISSSFIKTSKLNGIDIRINGNKNNQKLIIKDSYFENFNGLFFGSLTAEITNSIFINSNINLGYYNLSGQVPIRDISLYALNSTFSNNDLSAAIRCFSTLLSPSTLDSFDLNIKNCTFNGGLFDSTLNTDPNNPLNYQDYFGPDLDELKLEGCIFNNITGFNELPIDSSGGYNLFGFPQTIGLHSTDLQNVASTDIALGPLQDNGGLTPTHLPSIESIAFNGGNPNDTSDAQNGPIVQRRDIGATEIQAFKFTDSAKHCGLDYLWRDSLYTETGRYFKGIEGDSTELFDTVYVLNLDISNLQAQAINDWGLLTANESGAQYQWIDCSTNQPIFGETNQVFEPTTAGNYQVVIDNGVCIDSSSCMFINNIGLDEISETSIYTFVSQSTLYFFGNQNTIPFTIYNTIGQSVTKGTTQDKQVSLYGFTPGVYFIEFNTTENIKPIKFVVE